MPKTFIKNRNDKKLAVLVEEAPDRKGLVFVMHGLGGFKENDHIQVMAEVFLEKGYTTVRFDAANTFGESEGRYEEATIQNYYEDLEDVINWAKGQSWYQEPFYLAGQSLGGFCAAFYAQNHSKEVKALALMSTAISGKLDMEACPKEKLEKWRETGWWEEKSTSLPGVIKKLPWSHMEERLKHNLLEKAERLTMPTLLIVGGEDAVTPLAHQKILLEKLSGPKELHVIEGAAHTFREKAHLAELKKCIVEWLGKIEEKEYRY